MRISIDSRPSNPFADPKPGHDGWRTPTIEDAHHPRNLEMQRSHTSGLTEKSRDPQGWDGVHQRRAESNATASTGAGPSAGFEQQDDDTPSGAPEVVTNLSIRQRLKHVTWAWFTLVMATGGVASTLRAGRQAPSIKIVSHCSSSIPLHGSMDDWRHLLRGQYRLLRDHLGHDHLPLLVLPIHVQSIVQAPDGISIRTGGGRIIRSNPHQYR